MINYSVTAASLNKTFGRRLIFNDLNFEFASNGVYGIAGANGSGKSTLVKIIAGIISPSKGKIIHKINSQETAEINLYNHIGFVSPYLILYEEFSAWENINLFSSIRGIKFDKEKTEYLLNHFLIFDRKDDLVKTYSSGMKQRLKFVFALVHSPQLIILDEPTSNLDEEGKNSVYQIIEQEGKKGIVIVASNEKSDLSFCNNIIQLELFKRNNLV
ncbi:MAG TPA: ABC transporter ATP-binding protein [Ignavibacteriaceae bacterium]|nr:ABC transporter ATP-binding protein [Ignavibacteriaceae bacterium]